MAKKKTTQTKAQRAAMEAVARMDPSAKKNKKKKSKHNKTKEAEALSMQEPSRKKPRRKDPNDDFDGIVDDDAETRAVRKENSRKQQEAVATDRSRVARLASSGQVESSDEEGRDTALGTDMSLEHILGHHGITMEELQEFKQMKQFAVKGSDRDGTHQPQRLFFSSPGIEVHGGRPGQPIQNLNDSSTPGSSSTRAG